MKRITGNIWKLFLCTGILVSVGQVKAQKEIIEPLKYGDMDNWMVREVTESFVIGGETKYLYEITPGDTLRHNVPYKNVISPWATSSVMAKVSGVVKTSITVFPEKRDNGYCARLETRLENCKVLGLFNITVLAGGTIFLGEMVEPIKDTKNPQSKLMTGIPFTKRPKALMYDYKVITGGARIKATGFSKQAEIPGKDMAETCMLLQYRWEDTNGNVFAKRVGTAWERYDKSVYTWQNNHRLQVYYGNITTENFYQPYMALNNGESRYYTHNSKGVIVPVQEIGWASPNEKVTHLVLRISSSNGGAYIGSIGSKFWVDNVKMVY